MSYKRRYIKLIALILCAALSLCLAGCGSGSGGAGGSGSASGGSGSSASSSGDSSSGGSGSGSDSGDSSEDSDFEPRWTWTEFLTPEHGDWVEGNELVSVDLSNCSEGYVMIEYMGSAANAVLQVSIPDGSATYTYPILAGTQTFPLSCGDGTYKLVILEQTNGDFYAVAYSTSVDVTLNDEFRPYLYPNEYVNYTSDCKSVALGMELSYSSSDDLGYVSNVYNYVIDNITYDEAKAAGDLTYYVPDIDETLDTGTGICFDYASLMAAMLRSQRIPTKLVFGYSGTTYHAWVSVYLTEYGWVDGIIEFDGSSWELMDPTLGANNGASDVASYIGDGSNYTEKYWY